MFTPSLEGLDIAPDSLRVLRRLSPRHWPQRAIRATGRCTSPSKRSAAATAGVSAHAATIVTLALFAARVIRRRWFSILVTLCALMICYSRIYLGKHFPMDLVWGALVGATLGWAVCIAYRRLTKGKQADK